MQNAKWPGGQYRYYFNPANMPSTLKEADVLAAMQTAAARWAGMCAINFIYMGTTTITPNTRITLALPDRVNVWGFSTLTGDIAQFTGFAPWTVSDGTIIDADILLNNTNPDWTPVMVESVMTHEIGHAIGLSHSNVSASVMFATPYNSIAYNRVLRGDDATGCAALYGATADAQTNRTLNWAESVYTRELNAAPANTQQWDGYTYRFYGGAKNYVGTKGGNAYFLPEGGTIQNLGPVIDYWPRVTDAGF